jgi:choline transport protein
MLWGYVACFVLTLFACVSMAEMLSIWPTAAGQIHWSAVLAPSGWGLAFSFACGWLTITGQIALGAAAAFVVGGNFVGMYTLTHEGFESSRYQTILGYWGMRPSSCVASNAGCQTDF